MPVYLNGKEFETLAEYEEHIANSVVSYAWEYAKHHATLIEDYEGNKLFSVYLGSCMDLNFSGKYYLPFACSNVEYCEYCNGRGHVGWYAGYNIEALPQFRHTYTMTYNCPVCGWVGSEEAAKDEVYFEVLERIAGEYNMWVYYDGTDVFLQWEAE